MSKKNELKKILITGGAGFIGSNFATINQKKYDIVCLDNFFLGDIKNLENINVKFIEGDACKTEDLEKCFEGVPERSRRFDAVIHLAGTSSAPMFMDDGFADGYTNSVESFAKTIEFARKAGAKKFLYASTSSLYGNNPLPLLENQNLPDPLNHYSVTKKIYEDCSKCYHKVYPEMDIFGFRFMSVFGPNEESKGKYANIISQFLWDMVRDRQPVIYGDGEQFRDFTNVADIVQALSLAIETPENFGNKVYNVGRGESMSLNEIVTTIQKVIGKEVKPVYIENPVKEGYIKGQHADISKIKTELGFDPKVELVNGITSIYKNLDQSRIKETSSEDFR